MFRSLSPLAGRGEGEGTLSDAKRDADGVS
jgi:hypothetical protein